MADGADGADAGGAAPEALAKNPQDQFMDVVDKAQASIPTEKYARKALFILDRNKAPRKQAIALVEWKHFDSIIIVLILLNTLWMMLLTDPILNMKLKDDEAAGRDGGAGGFNSEARAAANGEEYDPSTTPNGTVMMLAHEYAAEAHSWAPLYRPFYDGCTLGSLPPCSIVSVIELIFLLLFTMELGLKLVAEGLIMHRGSYLRKGWNWLDLVVVVTGWLGFSGLDVNLSAIRALRPLRAVNRVRKLQVLVQCIITALPALGSIAVILLFVCVTYGIIGTQLFMGSTRHACYDCIGGYWGGVNGEECIGGDMESSGDVCSPLCKMDEDNYIDFVAHAHNPHADDPYTGSDSACSRDSHDLLYIKAGCGNEAHGYCTSLGSETISQYRHKGNNTFGNAPLFVWTCRPEQQCRCGESGEVDPVCLLTDNPNFGANNFDSVPWATFTMFQAITLEGWVDAMYAIIDGVGVFAFLYFCITVLFGACIILNLFLAVLCDNFAIAEEDPDLGEETEVDGEAEAADAAAALNHTNKFRQACLKIAVSTKFMYFVTGCILLNALLMVIVLNPDGTLEAKENYQPKGLFYTIWFLNATLTMIFTFESAVKIIGLGWKIFKMDSFNIFDLVVVIVSLLDVGLDVASIFAGKVIPQFFPVSVLRTFRIIRVLKLARSFENLRIILLTLTKSVASVQYLLILMLLIILIFALVGMEFFGGRWPRPEYNYTEEYYPNIFSSEKEPGYVGGWTEYEYVREGAEMRLTPKLRALPPSPPPSSVSPPPTPVSYAENLDPEGEDGGPSRYNFDSFGEAFLSIFVILSGENWNEIWWGAHKSAFYSPNALMWEGYSATIYFFTLFVIGNLIMFNLFIAILLSNFDEGDDDEEEAEGGSDEEEDEDLDPSSGPRKTASPSVGENGKEMPMMSYTFGNYRDPEEFELRRSGHIKVGGDASGVVDSSKEEEKPRRKSQAPPPDEPSGDKSCMLFSWSNPIRRGAAYLVYHPWFDPVIIFLILFSSVLLAIDDPRLDSDTGLKTTIRYMNYFFTVAFIIEMCLKIVVLGFIYSRNKAIPAYLRSGWNILDFTVVVISILSLLASVVPALSALDALKALRTFRALRPLRLISRLEGMKQVINTLIKSVPSVATLGVVAILFFGIFDIIAMQLFGGKLGACLDPAEVYLDSANGYAFGYPDDGLYGPGYECVLAGSCTAFTNKDFTFPPVNLYNRSDGPSVCADASYQPDWNPAEDAWPSDAVGVPCYGKPVMLSEDQAALMGEFGSGDSDGYVSGFLTLIDYDRDGIINDYEECMSMPKYNLTRRDSLGRLLTDVPEDEFGVYDPKLFYEFPQWVQPDFGNFDNFFWGFLLLFEVAALEGWPDVMFWVIDSNQHMQFVEPSRIEMHQKTCFEDGTCYARQNGEGTRYHGPANHFSNGWRLLYFGPSFFVLWILLGSFIILNMVVGVVLDAYNRIKSENSGTAFMTESQAEWVATQKSVIAMRPLRSADAPAQPWRMWAYNLVTWNIFDLFIMGVIVSNMLFMCIDHYDPLNPQMWTIRDVIDISNLIFLIIYIIEMLLKFVGLGFKQYFKDNWNKFDFTLVALSVIDFILAKSGSSVFPASVIRVLRLFRVVRILRIFKTAKSLRAILMTIILSMPALYNVTMLLTLFMFIFSVFCVNFFYSVAYTELPVALEYPAPDTYWFATTTSYGDFVNRHANFETFGMAILTLVRCVTGESFNGIMHDTMNPDWGTNMLRCCPTCGWIVDDEPVSSCGTSLASFPLFTIYCIFMSFVILALIIGVILDNFANVGSENKAVTVEMIEEFREVWLRYDPKGTFIVPSHNLLAILQQLKQPLGIADRTPTMSRAQMLQFLGELDIPDHGGQIHFLEALTALTYGAVGAIEVPYCDATKGLMKAAKKVPKLAGLEGAAHNALTNYLVSLLQSRWRGYAMRKKYSDHALGEGVPPGSQPPPPAAAAAEPGKVKSNQVAPAP